MVSRTVQSGLVIAGILATSAACSQDEGGNGPWQEEFTISECTLLTTGRNPYFVLEPGFKLVLEGGGDTLHITVLDETRMVDGVETRIVEEKEWIGGELYEISRNFFAICEGTNDAFYFGEDVDFYEGEQVVDHKGAWLAGVDDNKAGLIMSGSPRVGMKYYQEIAPGVALDRAEITSLDEVCETPAGTFANCLKAKEGTALNPLEIEYKYYAPNIGLLRDQDMVLTKYGFIAE